MRENHKMDGCENATKLHSQFRIEIEFLLWQTNGWWFYIKIEFMNLWFNWFSNSCESLSRQFPTMLYMLAASLQISVCIYLLSLNLWLNANIRNQHHHVDVCVWSWQVCQFVASNFLTVNSNYWCEMIEKNLLSIFFWIPIWYVPIIMIIISLIQICNLLLLLSFSLSTFVSHSL